MLISLELARKLKEAGLEWEPKNGDSFYWRGSLGVYTISVTSLWAEKNEEVIFAPRLDQLLAKIEKWGYSWEMRTVIDESQSVRFNAKNIAYWIHVWKTGHIEWEDGFKRAFTSPEEAAAVALIWICLKGS